MEAVHALAGVMDHKRAAKGVLVTTSWVGKASRDFAAANGRIQIVGGRNLEQMLKEHLGLDILIGLDKLPPGWQKTDVAPWQDAGMVAGRLRHGGLAYSLQVMFAVSEDAWHVELCVAGDGCPPGPAVLVAVVPDDDPSAEPFVSFAGPDVPVVVMRWFMAAVEAEIARVRPGPGVKVPSHAAGGDHPGQLRDGVQDRGSGGSAGSG